MLPLAFLHPSKSSVPKKDHPPLPASDKAYHGLRRNPGRPPSNFLSISAEFPPAHPPTDTRTPASFSDSCSFVALLRHTDSSVLQKICFVVVAAAIERTPLGIPILSSEVQPFHPPSFELFPPPPPPLLACPRFVRSPRSARVESIDAEEIIVRERLSHHSRHDRKNLGARVSQRGSATTDGWWQEGGDVREEDEGYSVAGKISSPAVV